MKAFVVNRIGDFGFLLGLFLLFWALGGAWAAAPGAPVRQRRVPADAAQRRFAARPTRPRPTRWRRGRRRQGRPHPQLPRAARPGRHRGAPAWREHLAAPDALGLAGCWPWSASCCSSAPWARARSSRSTSGCPTPWPAPRRSRPSSTPPPWSPPASTWWRGSTSSSRSRPAPWAGWRCIGALTALFAASIGFFQYDIKKVLAYSTVSPARLHVHRRGRGRLLGRHLPPAHPRLLQGHASSSARARSSSAATTSRTCGRWAGSEAHAHHRSGPTSSPARHRRLPRRPAASTPRTRSSGRRSPATAWRSSACRRRGSGRPSSARHRRRHRHRLLHVPQLLHDLHRRPTAAAARRTPTATAHGARPTSTAATRHDAARVAAGPITGGAGRRWRPARCWPRSSGLPALLDRAARRAFEHWLEPVAAARAGPLRRARATRPEWLLPGSSASSAGVVGWFFARALYQDDRSQVPGAAARTLGRAPGPWSTTSTTSTSSTQATVVRGSVAPGARSSPGSTARHRRPGEPGRRDRAGVVANLDGAIDRYLVDGAVNLVADATRRPGRSLRRVQTGRIQTYLYGALAGALVVVLLNFLIRVTRGTCAHDHASEHVLCLGHLLPARSGRRSSSLLGGRWRFLGQPAPSGSSTSGARVAGAAAPAASSLACAIAAWADVRPGAQPGVQFVQHFTWIEAFNIEYFVGVDGLSISMVLLTGLISFVATIASMPWWGGAKYRDGRHDRARPRRRRTTPSTSRCAWCRATWPCCCSCRPA